MKQQLSIENILQVTWKVQVEAAFNAGKIGSTPALLAEWYHQLGQVNNVQVWAAPLVIPGEQVTDMPSTGLFVTHEQVIIAVVGVSCFPKALKNVECIMNRLGHLNEMNKNTCFMLRTDAHSGSKSNECFTTSYDTWFALSVIGSQEIIDKVNVSPLWEGLPRHSSLLMAKVVL